LGTVKFSLLEKNLMRNVKNIRSKNELIDVTLVGDDGIQIGAHRIMLSACSTFFRNIFVNIKQMHPCVYLRGMKSFNISAILDFIYHGEVQVLQKHLQNFLEMVEDLGIQELTNFKAAPATATHDIIKMAMEEMKEADASQDNISSTVRPTQDNSSTSDLSCLTENLVEQIKSNREVMKYESLMEDIEVPRFDEEGLVVNVDMFGTGDDAHAAQNYSLDKQVEDMIQSVADGYWGCKKCGIIKKKKQHIKNHAESHLVGYSHPCPHCGKRSKTRNALANHISYFHKKPLTISNLVLPLTQQLDKIE